MDILVLSACSKSKRYEPVVDCEVADVSALSALVAEHDERVTSAEDMYIGREHQQVQTAVRRLRDFARVDWSIVSAGFGLLHAGMEIPSYDCAFSDHDDVQQRAARLGIDTRGLTRDETLRALAREVGIPETLSTRLDEGYDVVFVVLSRPYLLAVTEALSDIPESSTAFAFASEGSKDLVGKCTWIPATETERERLGTTWMELRGAVFSAFVSQLDEEVLENGLTPQAVKSLSS